MDATWPLTNDRKPWTSVQDDLLREAYGKAPVEHYGRQGGMMFNPDEVLDALKEKLIKK